MKPVRQLRRGVRGSCGETLLNLALIFIAALLPMSFATRAQAQTVLLNPLQNTLSNFTFGNLSFTITGCSFTYLGGSQPCLTDGTEIEGIFSGRGGTEIEILPTTGSYSQAAGLLNTSLNFKLTVTGLAGSRGLSSITNVLSATAGKSADNARISSVLSSFSNGAASATSNAGSLTSTSSFALTSSPLSFNVALGINTQSATSTLTLNSAKLLFQPAPEPASLAVLATGLAGLAVTRKRLRRSRARGRPTSTPAAPP